MKESYDRIDYSIVKLDENNKAITEQLGDCLLSTSGMVINHFSKKKKVEQNRPNIEDTFEEKRKRGSQIIRATLAEVVDFRAEFAERDSESQKVIDFLEQITPEQYVKKLSDSSRRIKVQ